jgi:BirA family biotin operon repressor/biotin-[acetyl-CoA-carboxylase] ligase
MDSQLALPGFSYARQYASVTSTMDTARELLQHEPPSSASWCAVVVADEQTAGRGRQGRAWLTTRGAFMATYLFATEVPVAAFTGYSLAVGVAVSSALQECGVQTQLKWPNDIVVITPYGTLRKLGGILIEVHEVVGCRCILVGLGINTTRPPEDIRDIAVGVEEVGGTAISAQDLLEPLSKALLVSHQLFVTQGGFRGVREAWMSRSCFVPDKTELAIELSEGQTLMGRFSGVEESGALMLDVNGSHHAVLSGHITSFVLNTGGT